MAHGTADQDASYYQGIRETAGPATERRLTVIIALCAIGALALLAYILIA